MKFSAGATCVFNIVSGNKYAAITDGTLKVEKYDDIYKTDTAANLKLTFRFSAVITAILMGSQFIVTASNLLFGTLICGIDNGLTAQPTLCTTASNVATCTSVKDITGDIILCCYGIAATDSATATTTSLLTSGITTDAANATNFIILNTPTGGAPLKTPHVSIAATVTSDKIAKLKDPVYYLAKI
jgi:hypothetical protein